MIIEKHGKTAKAIGEKQVFGTGPVTMCVLGSFVWLLWSYVVEIVCLDRDKTAYVNKVLILEILLFLEGPQILICSGILK